MRGLRKIAGPVERFTKDQRIDGEMKERLIMDAVEL